MILTYIKATPTGHYCNYENTKAVACGATFEELGGVDVKKFVNCRFAMTYWQLAGVSFAYRSYTLHGAVDPAIVLCALSQYLYLVKFFVWEIGYMRSIDIIVDRAGFYETWGCLVRTLVAHSSGLTALEVCG